MCKPSRNIRRFGTSDCSCGCCECGCGPSFRRFFSAHEELESLESYRDDLKKELAGVEEHINKCKCE